MSLEEIKTNLGKKILYAGISIIDVATGDNSVYEVKTKQDDDTYVLDEIFRVIQSYNPSEIIFNSENLSITKEYIISYLEVQNRNTHFNNYDDELYHELLSKT